MTNADQLKEGFENRTFEDELVVSADGVGFAVLADGQAQVADQRRCIFSRLLKMLPGSGFRVDLSFSSF